MGTKNFSNANDLITFSRSSAGTALRKIAYGSELVTNGDFSTDSDWTKGSGWSISGGVAVSNNASGFTDIKQSVDVTPNKIYRLDFSVASYTSGAVVPYLGNNGSADATPYDQGNLTNSFRATSAGEFYAFFVFDASQPGQIVLRANSGFIGTIDNISVKEVLFDQGDLTLFNHPADIPRIEYDADGNVLGLLVEESRTNLVTYSEDFTDASWTKTNTATLAVDAVGPDGQTSAVTLVDSGATGTDAVFVRLNKVITSSTNYTLSVFAKADGESYLGLGESGYDNGLATSFFDLSSGEVSVEDAAHTATIQNAGNGWYRCSITTSSVTDLDGNFRVYVSNEGILVDLDGTSSILIYGAQLEVGAFPTSYIPTNGATATRSADVASIPVADFGYNQSEGSVVVEYSSVASLNENYDFFIFNTNSSFDPESWGAYGRADSVNNVNGYRRSSSAYDSIDAVTSFDGNSGGKIALSQSKSNTSLSSTGLLDSTAFSSSNLSEITELDFANGAGVVGGKHSGHIKSIKYYPRRLTNAQLQELTT